MTRLLRCPQCAHELHVPEDVLGKKIRCLHCRAAFRAADDSAPVPAEDDDAEAPPRARGRRADDAVRGPAYALIGVGVVGLVAAAVWTFLYAAGAWSPMNWLNNRFGGEPKENPAALEWAGIAVVAVWAVIPAYSGLKMLRRENYSSVLIGCLVALLPVSPAVVLGVPGAAWALAVLCREDVRESFES